HVRAEHGAPDAAAGGRPRDLRRSNAHLRGSAGGRVGRGMNSLRAWCCAFALAMALPAFAKDWSTVRVATEAAYPPFNSVDKNGKLIGFDIDIANALCAEIKAKCVFVVQEWDGMIPALMARKFDAIISSMADTEERARVVAFTGKYYNGPTRFV